jgi:hypothetical protein
METTEVFGEKLEAPTREELKKLMLAKLDGVMAEQVDAPRELERKRVAAKLSAKQRL